MYRVFTKLGDGEWMHVATREKLEQAVQLAVSLNASWPREYVVRDSQGNGVTFGRERSMQSEHRSVPHITWRSRYPELFREFLDRLPRVF